MSPATEAGRLLKIQRELAALVAEQERLLIAAPDGVPERDNDRLAQIHVAICALIKQRDQQTGFDVDYDTFPAYLHKTWAAECRA